MPQLKTHHTIASEAVLKDLGSSKEGLSSSLATKRLNENGKNILPSAQKVSLLKIIISQVLNPLIFILVAAAIAAVLIGDIKDASFILIIILINTILGSYQEYQAERSAASLQQLIKIKSIVRRDKTDTAIDAENIVTGDIVLLESGAKVPSDLRLVESNQLTVDESLLTGESIAVKKQTAIVEESAVIAERFNMVFAGSTILSGRALGVTTATGSNTQIGLIAKDVHGASSAKPPLVLRMEKFTKNISHVIILISVILGIILKYLGYDWNSIFFFIVAMSVSAIPEGLPVSLTVALSIASKKMSKKNVVVRKLTAVESLGSCTVIASDKTGTLTVNQQTAKEIKLPNQPVFYLSGAGYQGEGNVFLDAANTKKTETIHQESLHLINKIAALANEAKLELIDGKWQSIGDAMDVALLAMSYKIGENPNDLRKQFPILGSIPYESENKYSGAFYSENDEVFAVAKGAVETIIERCNMNDSDKEEIISAATAQAKKGYRVLAFAHGKKENFEPKESYDTEDLQNLNFIGIISFIDPIRNEVKDAINKCHTAGIKVKMITGDHPETAKTIAKEIGIYSEGMTVVTGSLMLDLKKNNPQQLAQLIKTSNVFARVSPNQKLEIVNALIENGEYVAVTGDGVNDAPALKRANIGVAMGSGTDVAKEVGSMIVIDDNFSSIVAGVEEGRFAYDNIRKVIYLLISTGFAEIILFFASILAGLPLPLLAVQILWLNLVTNGIQDKALAFEEGEPESMQKKPRKPKEHIFNGIMVKQVIASGLFIGLVVFGFWFWLLNYKQMDEDHARNLALLLMVFLQNFHVFNCRSEMVSIFKIPLSRNWLLLVAVVLAQGIHLLSMHLPFMQEVLDVRPITYQEWANVMMLAIPVLLFMELFKWFMRRNSSPEIA